MSRGFFFSFSVLTSKVSHFKKEKEKKEKRKTDSSRNRSYDERRESLKNFLLCSFNTDLVDEAFDL